MRAANLDESVFDDLAGKGGENLISMFMPTHKKGREVTQDRIHLKNQLSAAEETLAELGYKPREREGRLAAAYDLVEDREFWEHQDAGLGVFVDEGGEVVAVSSGKPLDPESFVMPVFYLRPLMADISPVTAPVLALTKDAVALFSVTGSNVTELDVELPTYDEVNWFVDREKERQQHPDRVGTSRNRHGHEPSARADEDLARFLREVDSALKEFETSTPLIVLGDDDHVARFANHSEWATMSPESSGVRAPFTSDEVLEKVSGLLLDLERDRVDLARSSALDELGEGRATTDIEEALPAAVIGRVGGVVMDRNASPVWGRLDEGTHQVEVHESNRHGDVDLLDRLVVWARDTGAEVTSTEDPLEGRPFIAVYRY